MHITRTPVKQIEYASKLKLIDSHINKSESSKKFVNIQYEQILKMMDLKLVLQPPLEITPFLTKTVIFDTFDTQNLIVKGQTAPKGKNYILNVSAYTPIRLQIKINDNPAKNYAFEGNKGINIQQTSFDSINILASVSKMSIFSEVKLYFDLIQTQLSIPKKQSVNLRPNIDKQLEEYLVRNRGKSALIIQNRQLIRARELSSRKTLNIFNQPSIKNIELIRSKSEFQHFERKKQLYIKHVRKMSPSKVRVLEENEEKYYQGKKEQMAKLSILICIAKLASKIYATRMNQCRKNLKKMKVTMLCMDFIKIIKNKFRLKITEKARLRMCLHHTLQFAPLIQRDSTIRNAKETLLAFLIPFMDYRMIQELGNNSQQYLTSTVKIQKYARKKIVVLRQRIRLLSEKLMKIHIIDCDRKVVEQVIQKYAKLCSKKGGMVTKIFINQEQLILLLRKNNMP